MNWKKIIPIHPAVIAVWAALLAAMEFVPVTPIIGLKGATFRLSDALYPLTGILFGPWAGAICAAIGSFVGESLASPPIGPFTFVCVLAALMAGFAMQRRWIWPLVTILALGLVWYAFPLGREAWFQPFLYLLGIFAAIVGWIWGSDWLRSEDRKKMFAGVFVAALAGTAADHALGCLIALILYALPKGMWAAALPLAPVERLSFSLGAAIVGVPLIVALPRVGITVGPKIYE